MLDRDYIIANRPEIESILKTKKIKLDVDCLYKTIKERKSIINELNCIRNEKNSISKKIAEYKKQKSDCSELFKESKIIAEKTKKLNEVLRNIEEKEMEMMKWIPNIPHKSVPSGENAKFEIIKDCGSFDKKELSYDAITEKHKYTDFKRGAKIAASHFPLYIGKGAYLERILINFMIDVQIHLHNYKEVFVPYLVNENVLFSTGQLPKLKDDMYFIGNDDLYLIPTSEPPVTNIHMNEILRADELPIKYTTYSACFRREAGSYGKDTKGLKRVHQFNKVEMVRFVHPDDSDKELEIMVGNAEKILELLGLSYRVIIIPDNDLSFASSKTYDIEVWAPGSGEFLEVSSISNFNDFQSRRANIRFKDKNNKNIFIHTLNGSGLATPRTMISIIEKYQTEDGDFEFPPILQDYILRGASIFNEL